MGAGRSRDARWGAVLVPVSTAHAGKGTHTTLFLRNARAAPQTACPATSFRISRSRLPEEPLLSQRLRAAEILAGGAPSMPRGRPAPL